MCMFPSYTKVLATSNTIHLKYNNVIYYQLIWLIGLSWLPDWGHLTMLINIPIDNYNSIPYALCV